MTTLVRRAAMKVSGVVVRYASSGCKEWAEGLAREVKFVQGDWAALGWAIGSVRVLLDRRETPMITSLADVSERARLVLRSIHKESSGSMALFLLAFEHVLVRFLNAGTLQQRIGSGLVFFAATYSGIVLLIKRRKQPTPQGDDERIWALYYRSELERQRDFYRFGIGATYHVALFSGLMGAYLALGVPPQGDVRLHCMFAAVGVLCLLGYGLAELFLLRQRWQAQNQIIELDVVLDEAR